MAAAKKKVDACTKPMFWSDAVRLVLPQALAVATKNGDVRCNVRSLYYKVRTAISELGDQVVAISMEQGPELGRYNNFCADYWPTYADRNFYSNPLVPLIFNNVRGELVLPNGDRIPIGGEDPVPDLDIFDHSIERIIYIEKSGFIPTLVDARIHREFDCAMMSCQGFASVAARKLMAILADKGVQVAVLHDCDISGLNICNTIRGATKRMPNHSLDILDMGLSVEYGLTNGLISEAAPKANQSGNLTLSDVESDFLVDRKLRFELDSIPDIVGYVRDALIAAGFTSKCVPPEDYLIDTYTRSLKSQLTERVEEIAWEQLSLDELTDGVVQALSRSTDDLDSYVREQLTKNPMQSWRRPLVMAAYSDVSDNDDSVVEATREWLVRGDVE
jgi:hypothetical protein